MNEHELRAAPYKLGGRTAAGLDCLGVALAISNELGNEWGDPFAAFLSQWRADHKPPVSATGFPATWRRVLCARTGGVRDGDVWVWHALADHPTVGIVRDGRVWTATPAAGVVAITPEKATQPDEVWRP